MTKTLPTDTIDIQKVTQITVGEHDVLYIRINADGFPNNSIPSPKHCEAVVRSVKEAFGKAFLKNEIIVGFYDLKFTAITKKQHFSAKLTGDVS